MAKTSSATTAEDDGVENSGVSAELLKACQEHKPNFKAQRENEADASYIERVLTAIADVPDEIYNALSPAAKDWFAAAAETANAGGEPAAPEGFRSAYRPKQPKQAKKKLITREKPQKPLKVTGPTMGALIRRAIINDRNVSVQDLESMLAQNGFTDIKRTTVFSFQRGSLDTLKVAEEMGRFHWPPEQQAAAQ